MTTIRWMYGLAEVKSRIAVQIHGHGPMERHGCILDGRPVSVFASNIISVFCRFSIGTTIVSLRIDEYWQCTEIDVDEFHLFDIETIHLSIGIRRINVSTSVMTTTCSPQPPPEMKPPCPSLWIYNKELNNCYRVDYITFYLNRIDMFEDIFWYNIHHVGSMSTALRRSWRKFNVDSFGWRRRLC